MTTTSLLARGRFHTRDPAVRKIIVPLLLANKAAQKSRTAPYLRLAYKRASPETSEQWKKLLFHCEPLGAS